VASSSSASCSPPAMEVGSGWKGGIRTRYVPGSLPTRPWRLDKRDQQSSSCSTASAWRSPDATIPDCCGNTKQDKPAIVLRIAFICVDPIDARRERVGTANLADFERQAGYFTAACPAF